jgi:hypothetical protein
MRGNITAPRLAKDEDRVTTENTEAQRRKKKDGRKARSSTDVTDTHR